MFFTERVEEKQTSKAHHQTLSKDAIHLDTVASLNTVWQAFLFPILLRIAMRRSHRPLMGLHRPRFKVRRGPGCSEILEEVVNKPRLSASFSILYLFIGNATSDLRCAHRSLPEVVSILRHGLEFPVYLLSWRSGKKASTLLRCWCIAFRQQRSKLYMMFFTALLKPPTTVAAVEKSSECLLSRLL